MDKHLRVIALTFLVLFFNTDKLLSQSKNQQLKYNFNSEWLVNVGEVTNGADPKLADTSWKKVTLPRAFNEDEAFKLPIDSLSTSIVWYRKHFALPKEAKGKKVFIEFEGIRFGGEFYINGKSIGIHENGVMAVGLDVTDYLNPNGKDNIIAARIDNSWKYKERATQSNYQWNDKNFNANYGGIPKNVYLHVKDRVYQTLPLYSNLGTTGTYVYAKQINISNRTAIIRAESEVRNEHNTSKNIRYEVKVEDMDGKVVKTFSGTNKTLKPGETAVLSAEEEIGNLNFWSWGYGYLYNIYTTLYVDNRPVDVVNTRTGFRKTRFADGMVWLNDRVIQMKGYAQRTSNEWPAVGMSVPAWLSDYSNKLMVDSNANLVRWMHVTPWKQDVESCDRVGLMQAMPAGDSEKDVEGRRWELRTLLMRDAIIYNRNNPSIIFYECGNESISEEHMAEMKAIRDKYDPFGGRAIGSREMLDSQIAEYGGEMLYINKSAHIPMWATEYCRDEALRKYWDDYSYPFHKNGEGVNEYKSTVTNTSQKKDARAYNQNQDSFVRADVSTWWDYYRVRPGTGTRVSSGGVNIIFSDSNTHFRGVENYRRSGEVDAMRIAKDAFYAHQVMWDGWVDVENYRTHLVGHWNYTPDVVKDVYAVSSGEQAELFVNGKSQGMGERSNGFLFTFKDIKWQEGTIEAVSYDANKKELSRAKIKTAGKPAAIKLTEMHAPDGFKADGGDLALVQVEVVDAQGNRCPLANDAISFELNGPAEWRGGIAQGKDNYILSKILPVECGVNRVLIRSTNKAGKITLSATAKGLTPASIGFTTVTAKQKNGLSGYISGNHQPSNLQRGATPKGASYKESRKAIKIVGALTDTNTDKVKQSFDDNELSEWTNNGDIKTGWITYELERDAEISEIELKLTGWRMRSYPIIISVDGKEVYSGDTEKSLGYISIPVKPTKGRFVKIQLKGQSQDKDAYGEIIEITGNKELDLYKDPNAADGKGQLRIVEVEVYEKVN
ncbi:DUF4982 domain-containing protein [Flavobacterium sp. Sd200]|uniref:DUF4982 domain-containing protein n=1 Tax=Flavobacterium sp. Sd200 TaxID=2692211 RepID=UPI00136D1577|nr:DUF4982 domain-containing protein [Flavobacterium sp. Sd200]MXN90121.1 DUF4982 domain-containing protein [Flavobacterium sp. Sd200]